jgi:hemoglobin/transferrin/lactoferrin receptor protein
VIASQASIRTLDLFERTTMECPLNRSPVFAAVALVLSSPLLAQTSDFDAPEATVPSTSLALEPVVVSATRTERPKFRTPASVSIIDREDIDRSQPYGYQDVFETVPGVNIQGGPRRIAEEPAIRGFADEQVVIRLDGTRQNYNKAHGGRFLLDPDLIRSIEVLRGASSAIYGSGALGGVFVIESVNGRDLTGGMDGLGMRLKAGYQSNGDEWAGYGTLYGQSGAFDGLVSYVKRNVGEDLTDGSGDDLFATQDKIDNGLVKIGFEPGRYHRIELSADRFENSGLNPTNANAVATPNTLVDRETERSSTRLRYTFDDPSNRWLNLDVAAYANDADAFEFRLDDARVDQTNFETRGLEVVNTTSFGQTALDGLRLTYGFELYGDQQRGTRNGADRPQFPTADIDYRAAFVQAEIPLGDTVSLIPGLRYDEFEYSAGGDFADREDERASPRVAIGWSPNADLYLWAEYAEAFRAPSLTELYADGVHFVVPLGPGQVVINEFMATPDLEAEQAEQVQAGVRWRRDDLFGSGMDFEVDVTAWRSQVDDFVDQVVIFIAGEPTFDPITQTLVFPGITTNRNVDAELDGFEAVARLDGSRGWLQATWTRVNGKGAAGENLASLQPERASLGGGLYLLDRQLSVGAELVAARARDDVPEGALETAGYGKTDLFVDWSPADGPLDGFEFRLALDNVFDKDYRIHPNGIDQPGRSIRLTVARDFQWLNP